MKPLRVSEDVVPIAQFKSEAPKWLRRAADSGQPILITLNGRPAGVLLSPAEYDRLIERQRLFDSIAAGIADAEAGRVMDTDELKRRLQTHREERTRS